MKTNRISALLHDSPSSVKAPEPGFVARPQFFAAAHLNSWQAELYRLAFEQARAAVEARRKAIALAYQWN